MKSKKAQERELKELALTSFELGRVTPGKGGVVFFDAEINGITVHGMKVVPLRDGSGDFVAWPSYKGADGKYYSVCFAKFNDETEKSILAKIQEALDAADN